MMRQLARGVGSALLLAAAVVIAGCGTPYTTVELPGPFVRRDYERTERLIPPLLFDITGAYMELYLEEPDGDLVFLGRERSDYRNRFYAISEDGRSIVWRQGVGPERPKGVYRYDPESGVREVCGDLSLRQVEGRDVPSQLLAFTSAAPDPDRRTWAFDASGERLLLALYRAHPIHEAAYDGDEAALDGLLAAGAEPDATTYWGHTPLEIAIVRGHEDAAVRLIEAGAPAALSEGSAAALACLLQRDAVLRALCRMSKETGEPFADGEPLVFWAAGSPYLEGEEGPGSHDDIFGPTQNVEDRVLESLRALADCGVDPNVRGPLEGERGPLRGGTALHGAIAVKRGADVIEALLAMGVDLGARDGDGRTALHSAVARKADPAVVDVLIAAGADPNTRDSAGRSPLHDAVVREPVPAAIEALLRAGADADAEDRDHALPLSRLGWSDEHLIGDEWETRYLPALRALIAHTSNIDHVDGNGVTALQNAVLHRRFRTARVLAASGADTTLPCHRPVPECRRLSVMECVRRIEADRG